MSSSIGRFWRVLATGFSFALFGVGGVVLRVLVFPLLALCVHEPAAHQRAARGAVSMSFRAFVGVMRLLGVLRYEVRGLDKLDRKGQLILANHPTLIDTVFLIAFVPNADCIVKGALSNNPFMRGPIRAAGYIRNDRGAGPGRRLHRIAARRWKPDHFPGRDAHAAWQHGDVEAWRCQHRGARSPGRDTGPDSLQSSHVGQGRQVVACPAAPGAFSHRRPGRYRG